MGAEITHVCEGEAVPPLGSLVPRRTVVWDRVVGFRVRFLGLGIRGLRVWGLGFRAKTV